jgi:hypothetical protein
VVAPLSVLAARATAPLADALPETALTILKWGLLALVYLFLARIVRVVVLEMRTPTPGATPGPAVDGGRKSKKAGARLRILEPAEQRGATYPLGDELTVGRGGGCGVVLPDDNFVSTVHARLFRRGDDLFVEDLGSRNGTFVNGEQLQAPQRLRRGDRVQFGQTVTEVTR